MKDTWCYDRISIAMDLADISWWNKSSIANIKYNPLKLKPTDVYFNRSMH
jgi:hypothetical protein